MTSHTAADPKPKTVADLDAPKTVADLMRVSGLGRDTVRAAIRTGELPGLKVGRRYTIPAEAFRRFCAGDWSPRSRPIFTEVIHPTFIEPSDMIRKRAS